MEGVQENNNFTRKKGIFLPILVVAIIGVILIFGLALIIVLFYFLSQPKNEGNVHSKLYKYKEFNPQTGKTKIGFSRLYQNLGKDEYVSYKNEENGNFFITSHLGGIEYECEGSCYCDKDNFEKEGERRFASTSPTLTKGLFALFSAFSVVVAVNMASESFENTCVERFSDICDPSHIKSEVGVCVEASETGDEKVERWNYENSKPLAEVNSKDIQWFSCAGYCVKNGDFNPAGSIIPDLFSANSDEIFSECERHELQRFIKIPPFDPLKLDEYGNSILPGYWRYSGKQVAETIFAKQNLNSFCAYASITLISQQTSKPRKKIFEIINEKGSFDYEKLEKMLYCIAIKNPNGINENFECIRIDEPDHDALQGLPNPTQQ